MAIYELTPNAILKVEETSLVSLGIKERQDLQRILRTQIGIILPGIYVLAEEFGDWEDARRSIDLLCIDTRANLVVVELKRTEDGGHMELQAIRYAAMVSKMRFSEAVTAHEAFLKKVGRGSENAESEILKFLGWDQAQPGEFAQDVRIVLISNNFNKEITTAAMWLRDYELDIECIRLHSYKIGEKTFLDIQKIVPLPEAAAYQVQLRQKAAEVREANARTTDWSRYNLEIGGEKFPRLFKRELFLFTVLGLSKQGVTVSKMQETIPQRKFVGIDGKLSGEQFRTSLSHMQTVSGSAYPPNRFYLEDDELFLSEGKTWALSNQWSVHQLPLLNELAKGFPEAKISFDKATEEAGI
jgi:hypothetical protein